MVKRVLVAAVLVVVVCLAVPSASADDPRIFSEPSMMQPNATLGPVMEAQMEIALAAGGGQFLAAWKDGRRQDYGLHGFAFRSSLFFGRVRADGTVLDPVGVQLGEGPHDGYPAVSWNGQNFLVVWQIGRYICCGYDIHACRVSPDGVMLDGLDGFVVAGTTNDDWKPAVASDGADWFVVWQNGWTDAVSRIYGTRITASGQVVTPGGARLCQTESPQLRPTIAWTGSRYMVAFHDKRNDAGDIYALRVQADGTVLDPNGFVVCAAEGEQCETAIAPIGVGAALIAWEDSRNAGTGKDIYACRVTNLAEVLDPSGIAVCDVAEDQRWPKAAGFGGNCVITWQDYRSSPYAAYAARVRPNGLVLDPDGFAVGLAGTYQWMPCVAADSATCLFGWAQAPGNYEPAYEALGRRFDTGMQPIEPQPFPICQAAPDQGRIDVVRTNAGFMTVFEESNTDPWDADLYLAPLDSDGNLAPGGKIPLSLAPEWDMAAAIAFDGTNCLVAWSNRQNDLGDIFAARVTPQGLVLDSPPIAVCVQQGFQIPVCLAYGAGVYLAAWEDFRSGTYRHIYAARIAPDGTVLDPNGFLIQAPPEGSSAVLPAVGWNGTTFLVTWWECSGSDPTHIATSIMGRFINAASPQLSSPAFLIESAEEGGWVESPVVDWSGSKHLVIWEHCPSGSLRHVAGKRILPDGTILDASPIEISSSGDNSQLALAWNGDAHVVLWRSDGSSGVGGYVARVLDTGEVVHPGGMRAFELCLNDPACNCDPQLRLVPRGDGKVLLLHTTYVPPPPYGADRIFENWFTPPQIVGSIAAARSMPDGSFITIVGKPVTAGTDDFDGVFYIQEPDRTGGMRVLWSVGQVPRGAVAAVSGVLNTIAGERVVEAQAVCLL